MLLCMARQKHTPQYKTVAEALRALGYTHQQAAGIIGCDRTWITRLANGEKIVSLKIPLRICRTLGVPIEALADQDAA